MSFRLNILDADANPALAGTTLTLLGNGEILAKSVVDDEGFVEFDVQVEGVENLSVRVDPEMGAPDSLFTNTHSPT